MNLWQIILAVALVALWAWVLVAVLIDMFNRSNLLGWVRVAWIAFIVLLPLLGVIAYVIVRPRLTEEEREAAASWMEATVPDGELVAEQIGDLARLHAEGLITDEEYEERKQKLI